MSEIDEFFKGLPSQDKTAADVFQDKPKDDTEEVPPKAEEIEEEPRKNRQHRRLEEKLQRERESNIALAERIKVLSEVEDSKREALADGLDPDFIRVFGDSDQGREVARIMANKISAAQEATEQRTIQRIEAKQAQAIEEQKQYESLIDSELEALEDEYNVDLTSDAPKARKERREFLELIQNLSPKDSNGTITGYADFGSTFDIYQKTRTQDKSPETITRQKELASRSMQRSSQSNPAQQQQTPGFDGWKRDYGLE